MLLRELPIPTNIVEKLNNENIYRVSDIAHYSLTSFVEEMGYLLSSKEMRIVLNATSNALIINQYGEEKTKLVEGYILTNGCIVNEVTGVEIKDAPLDVLGLSVRPDNKLREMGISTVSDLLKVSISDLKKIPYLGYTSINEIIKKLEIYLLEDKTKVKPAFNGSNYDVFEYKGSLYYDVRIDELDFSTRAYNCLSRNGVQNIHQLLLIDEEYLMQFRNMGKGTVTEIQNLINHFLSENKIENITKEVEDRQQDEGDRDSVRIIEDINRALEVIQDHSLEGITIEQLSLRLFNQIQLDKTEAIINNLLEQGEIIENKGYYLKQKKSVVEILQKRAFDRDVKITLDRLSGLTLAEIGKKYDFTRERARQIIGNVLSSRSLGSRQDILEEQYKYIFTTYALNAAAWNELIDDDITSFYYLASLYKKGKADPALMTDDVSVPDRIKEQIKLKDAEDIVKDTICIGGELVPLRKKDLEEYVIKHFFQEEGTIDEYFLKYNAVLEDAGVDKNTGLYVPKEQEASRINKIAADRIVLWKQNKKLRYYDIDAQDYKELIDTIDLSQYDEVEISTKKWMNEFPVVMQKYDIRDEYELHNLLKKILDDERITFGRMPMIVFSSSGKYDRDKFILDLLSKIAPVSKAELLHILSEITGVSEMAIGWNWLAPFESLYENGIFVNPTNGK